MSAQSPQTEPPRAPRRRRKPQPGRRLPSLAEQREKKPIAFGWGADLSAREREGLKERIALLAGILLAVVVVGLLAWGLFVDNVWNPMQRQAENNKEVASIGNYVIKMGDFKRFEAFQNNTFNNDVQQLQAQLQQYQADPKKNAAIIQQINSQLSVYTQALSNLPQTSLNDLINEQVVLQRAKSAGVGATPKQVNKIMTALQHQFGGPRHFQTFVDKSGLTLTEIRNLQVSDWMRGELQKKLASQVSPYQPEVRASHILVKSHAQALRILALAKKPGATFAALAKKYSTDAASAKHGGDLGYFARDRMVQQFSDAAFAMKVGQMRLAHSTFGWHIIKVTGRKTVHVSAKEYDALKSGALDTWIQKQTALLHLEKYIKPESLPNLATPVASPVGLSSNPVAPSQPTVPQQSQPHPKSLPVGSQPGHRNPSSQPAKGGRKP